MKRFLWLLALVVVTAACGVRDESSSSTGDTAPPAIDGEGPVLPDCPVDALADAEGVVEVELWHALGSEAENTLEALATEFNGSQDAVRVQVRNQGVSYDEVMQKFVAAIPSRQLPEVVYLEDTVLRQIVDSGVILPAEACEEADDFATGQLPAVRAYYTADGVYWPAYTNVSEPVLYYNRNHFRRAGLDPDDPPTTLEEVREAARALKAAGIRAPLSYVLNTWFVESWISGAGETVVNEDDGRSGIPTESTFDNDVTREIYTWIDEMTEEGLLEGHSATGGQINQYLAVAQQNSSMLIETSTAATTIKTVLGGGSDDIDVGSTDLSVIDPAAGPFPGLHEPGQVRVSGGAFFLTNTPSPEEQAGAWAFTRFMWETDSQLAWHLTGGYLPTTQTAAGAPEVATYWADDLAGRMLEVGYDQLLTVDPSHPGPQIGPYRSFSDAIKTSLDRLVLRRDSVDEVIAAADREIQAAIERYAEDNG
ncbi:MAG TPA: extracellular solute-binding protein [Acidimicrobiales bacterium]|nr:extracellular solute-binding protein [Acidimicrobiales bacterium]